MSLIVIKGLKSSAFCPLQFHCLFLQPEAKKCVLLFQVNFLLVCVESYSISKAFTTHNKKMCFFFVRKIIFDSGKKFGQHQLNKHVCR